MTTKGNSFSNAKMIFLIFFTCLALAWMAYDYRAGESMVGPGIFLAILAVTALIFKPWRTGMDG